MNLVLQTKAAKVTAGPRAVHWRSRLNSRVGAALGAAAVGLGMMSPIGSADLEAAMGTAAAVAAQPAPTIRTDDEYVRLALLGVLTDDADFDPSNPVIPGPNKGELRTMARVLQLDDEQAEIVEALLQGALESAFASAMDVMREYGDEMKAAEEDPDASAALMMAIGPKLQAAMTDVLNMLTIFEADLEQTLTAEQMQRWPIYIAGVLRRDTLGNSPRPLGLRADLHTLTLELASLAEHPDIARAVEREVIAWSDQLTNQITRLMAIQQEEANDTEGRVSFDPDVREARLARHTERWKRRLAIGDDVAELNLQYYEQILALLPPAVASEFERQFHREVLPLELARSRVEPLFLAALGLEDLDGTQREALSSALEHHQARWVELTRPVIEVERRLHDMMTRLSPTTLGWIEPQYFVRQLHWQVEQGDPTATAEQVRAFEDLTRRWQRQLEDQMRFMKSGVEEVRAILTPEQMAQLEVPPIRPPIELIGLLDELRIRLTSGEFDGPGPHLVEFAGGVVRIENRLGHLDYDPMWIEEGRTMHVPRVVDLDFTDDITPDERSRDSDSN